MSNSVRPHRRQPTRLPHPWNSPGKNTGVGCHFLLQCMKVKSESEVTQSCPTLSDPMDWSLPGSSIHGIFQARVLEWGAIAFSNGYATLPIRVNRLTIGIRMEKRIFSFFFFFFRLFIFGCAGSSLLHAGFLWLRPAGAVSSCGVWASCCLGFSLRITALGSQVQ